jgi:hypothetical protein
MLSDSEADAEVSAETVRGMTSDELCKWLSAHPLFSDVVKFQITKDIIEQQYIDGYCFLSFTLEQWVNYARVPAGVAHSLVCIAQELTGEREKITKATVVHDVHPNRLKRWTLINKGIEEIKKKKGNESKSIAYSSLTWDVFRPIFFNEISIYSQATQHAYS